MVPDLVQDRRADVAHQVSFATGGVLDVLLKDVDDRRADARLLDAALRERQAVVQTEQEVALRESDALELLARRAIADLDRHLLEKLGEARRQLRQRPLH